MPSLWFIVPVHGRLPLAAICLRQLRRTCDQLVEHGINATAVIVADADNLRELRRRLSTAGLPSLLGFGWVTRGNEYLSRKFNDGFQLACDPAFNPRPADYVVPCGSDDWVDWRIFLELPDRHTVLGWQHMTFVREDGREMVTRFLDYPGGCGVRVYPRQILAATGFRPADEDRARACDTSILTNLRSIHGDRMLIRHGDIDPRQIVDWKTHGQQLNSYQALYRHRSEGQTGDPFVELTDIYPADALREMASHYRLRTRVAA